MIPAEALANFDRFIEPDSETGCWRWIGNCGTQGYGIYVHHRKIYSVHRTMYALIHGPIPAGLVIDHLCRVRECCNPDHLEAVTNAENVRRGNKGFWLLYCPKGHLKIRTVKGQGYCPACGRERSRLKRPPTHYRRVRRPQQVMIGYEPPTR